MAKEKTESKAPEETVIPAAADDGMTTVHLIYDGDRYVDSVKVGFNGKMFIIPRGKDVKVPNPVAEILRHSEEQDMKTRKMILRMERKAIEETRE